MPGMNRSVRRVAVCVLLAVLGVEFGLAVSDRSNDFTCHLGYGRQFRDRDPHLADYAHYPLGRHALSAALGVAGDRPAQAVGFLLALGCGWLAVRVWTSSGDDSHAGRNRTAAVLAGLMLAGVLKRDLDESGQQLVLLGILSAAGWTLAKNRSVSAGLLLAAAFTYKTMPVLFLPLLLWKRRWTAAAAMVAGSVVLNAAPVLYLGPDVANGYHGAWARTLLDAGTGDPSVNPIEAPKPYNQSLQVALARVLRHYPPGHGMHVDHPAFVQFLDLPPERVGGIVLAVVALLGAAVAWRMRRPWPADATPDPAFARDWAVAIAFCAVLSPLCWKQHLVLLWPCAFLTVRHAVRCGTWRAAWPAVAAAVLLVGSSRGVIGRDPSVLAMSYKTYTLAGMLLIGAVLWRRTGAKSAAGERSRWSRLIGESRESCGRMETSSS